MLPASMQNPWHLSFHKVSYVPLKSQETGIACVSVIPWHVFEKLFHWIKKAVVVPDQFGKT